jgi:hypothetical protein
MLDMAVLFSTAVFISSLFFLGAVASGDQQA